LEGGEAGQHTAGARKSGERARGAGGEEGKEKAHKRKRTPPPRRGARRYQRRKSVAATATTVVGEGTFTPGISAVARRRRRGLGRGVPLLGLRGTLRRAGTALHAARIATAARLAALLTDRMIEGD